MLLVWYYKHDLVMVDKPGWRGMKLTENIAQENQGCNRCFLRNCVDSMFSQ